MLIPTKLDFKDIRIVRQKNNNKAVYESIKANDVKTFNKNINVLELVRTLEDLEMTKDEFLKKCREDDCFCKLAARNLSKCATRQGNKDETEQFKTCNFTTQKCGVSIKNLTATEFRPTKDGRIVSQKTVKKENIQEDNWLKSFDGSLSGKMTGYITAKISYGMGGHQDNVFEEMYANADWWKIHKANTEEMLVILIDTDLLNKFTRIKEKYNDIKNILVVNHVELQQYIIDTYYSLD